MSNETKAALRAKANDPGCGCGVGATVGFGTILAIVLSWTSHQAIGWAIVHGFLSWIYVVYWLFTNDGWTWF